MLTITAPKLPKWATPQGIEVIGQYENGAGIVFVAANLVEASSPILACYSEGGGEGEWQSTPYQTANARHWAETAVELVRNYWE